MRPCEAKGPPLAGPSLFDLHHLAGFWSEAKILGRFSRGAKVRIAGSCLVDRYSVNVARTRFDFSMYAHQSKEPGTI